MNEGYQQIHSQTHSQTHLSPLAGNSIVWEFATDNYDIGFGLFFEPNENPGDQVQLLVSESEDEEEEEEEEPVDPSDPEKGSRKAKKHSKVPYVLPIIPISRRDCFEEVYCGSHVFPGEVIESQVETLNIDFKLQVFKFKVNFKPEILF